MLYTLLIGDARVYARGLELFVVFERLVELLPGDFEVFVGLLQGALLVSLGSSLQPDLVLH